MASWAKSKNVGSDFGNMPIKDRLLRDAMLGILFVFSIFALIANVSYSYSDPSFNVSSDADVKNWLGRFGADVADIMRQIFGMTSIPLVIVIGSISIFALLKGPYKIAHPKLRVFMAFFSIWLLGIVFSAIPPSPNWSLATGFGGMFGDLSLGLFTFAFKHIWWSKAIFGGIAFIGFLVSLYFVFNLNLRDLNSAVDCAGYYWSGLRVFFDKFSRGRNSDRRNKNSQTSEDYADDYAQDDYSQNNYSRDNFAPEAKSTKLKASNARVKEPIAPHDDFDDDINVGNPQFEGSIKNSNVQVSIPKQKAPKAEALDQPTLPFGSSGEFELPRLDLLQPPAERRQAHDPAALRQNAHLLMNVLEQYKVNGEIVNVSPGPVVTLYELKPAAGIKSQRVISLADDIARSMSAVSARVAVVKGKNAIGIELPNANRESVYLRSLLTSDGYMNGKAALPMALGESIGGKPWVADLTKMPHLLIAGTTGSGKSVGINAMILSMLFRLTPDQCRFIMIDPKMVELSVYNDIPHLLTPVVTDPKKAVSALKWAVREMENRYNLMSKLGVRNISSYNERAERAARNGEVIEVMEKTGFDPETGRVIQEKRAIELRHMPFIVIVIDEMADLMMIAGKEIEGLVQRLAQMARAVGIHLITATQRPSVDVITGTIKANFPTRISYMVTSKTDSRVILGFDGGAEQLLGLGDLLFVENGGRATRLHGPFVSDEEVGQIVDALKAQGEPQYFEDITNYEDEGDVNPTFSANSGDELYDKAVEIIARDRKVSTSYLQRRLSIGYNRAADLVDRLERDGMISAADHVGRRQVLLPDHGE